MRNTIFGRRGLPLALAAVLVVSLPATRPAWAVAMSNTRELLNSELPAGVTLQRATVDQTAAAVHAAVKARPDLATDIVRVAILAKKGHRRGEGFKDAKRATRATRPRATWCADHRGGHLRRPGPRQRHHPDGALARARLRRRASGDQRHRMIPA